MGTLERILKSFGATADFWITVGNAEEEAPRDEASPARPLGEDEAWDELKALVAGLSDEEDALVREKLNDVVSSKKSIHKVLAEIYAARGDSEAVARVRGRAAEAASKAREALLRDHLDPQDLCCLGHQLLERCDADELPLCAEHFIGSYIEFGNGDTLQVGYVSFFDPRVEEFSNEPETLSLAIRAYGLAWLRYWALAEKRSDAWRALPALDGLRAAFLHADNLEALQAVNDTFWDWLEDWGLDRLCDDFVANFRSSDAYLQGRLRRDPANRQLTRRKLAGELGAIWDRLPQVTRQYLINAEILFEHLDKKGDWSSAVNDYSKAVESLLRLRLGAYVDENPDTPVALILRTAVNGRRRKPVRKFANLSLSTFKDALGEIEGRLPAMLAQVADHLRRLVPARTRATHATDVWKVSHDEAERAKNVSKTIIRLLADLRLL